MKNRICAFLLAAALTFMTACTESKKNEADSLSSEGTAAATTTKAETTAKAETTTKATEATSAASTAEKQQRVLYFPDKTDTKWETKFDEPFDLDKLLMNLHTKERIIQKYDPIDTDDDGLPDSYEKDIQTDPNKKDTDGDGLTDGEEIIYTHTNPLKAKTIGNREQNDAQSDNDKDGLTARQELDAGTAPYYADSDQDGLSDGDELNKYKTDPKKMDTDGDGIFDGDEIAYGTDPLKPQTNGKKDAERFSPCKVYPYDPSLDRLNRNNENFYTVSLMYDAFEGTEQQLTASVRNRRVNKQYSYVTVPGNGVALIQPKECNFKNGIIYFKISEKYINETLKEEFGGKKGVKLLAVCGVNKELGEYFLLETKYDPENNIIYARTQQYTEFEVINTRYFNGALTAL